MSAAPEILSPIILQQQQCQHPETPAPAVVSTAVSTKTDRLAQLPTTAPAAAGERKFTLFPHLPTELRLKIWDMACPRRVVEIHSQRSHYAKEMMPQWQSSCGNPAVLSACAESRAEALRRRYSVSLPVLRSTSDLYGVCVKGRRESDEFERERVLYLDPARDTLVVLGELDYRRLSALFAAVQAQDPAGRGLQRVGLSVTCWAHEFAGATLRIWAKTLFSRLEQFILLMYTERLPPASFRDGECVLEDCQGMDRFMRFVMGRGREFKSGNAWMVVGQTEMRIMNLGFVCDQGHKVLRM